MRALAEHPEGHHGQRGSAFSVGQDDTRPASVRQAAGDQDQSRSRIRRGGLGLRAARGVATSRQAGILGTTEERHGRDEH